MLPLIFWNHDMMQDKVPRFKFDDVGLPQWYQNLISFTIQ